MERKYHIQAGTKKLQMTGINIHIWIYKFFISDLANFKHFILGAFSNHYALKG